MGCDTLSPPLPRGSSDAEARLLATSWDADPQGGGRPAPILWEHQEHRTGTRQAQRATPHPLLFSSTEAGRGQGTDTVPEFGKLWLGSVTQSPSLRGAWGCQACCSIVLA